MAVEISRGKDKPRFDNNYELIFELAKQAWSLSSEQLELIKPGAEGLQNLYNTLDIPLPADRPLVPKTNFEFENPHIHILKVMRDPNFFPFTCRSLMNRPDGGGPLNILPFQQLGLQELWWRQFPMIVWSRGASKTFLLGLYALLRAVFTPGSKIVITGAAFRQSKAVFEYIERIWHNSPVLKSLVNNSRGYKRGIEGRQNGPRRDIDRVEFIVGDSVITGIPLGSGEKVRGLRANYILADEMASISESIYAIVVQGFASVTADPIGNVKDLAKINLLKRVGLWSSEMDDQELKKVRGNQSVLSGTASYSFNHFYKYFKDYKNIIESCGDKQKLEKIFNGPVPDGFKWNSYSIFRLPFQLIPKGFMDEQTIIRAKRITSTSEYQLEYEACLCIDTPILTSCGIKKIQDIKIGDEVLTHKGRFRKVFKKTFRYYSDDIIGTLTYGCNQKILTTKDHPYWINDDKWDIPQNLIKNTNLVNLKELNGKVQIDIRDYTSGWAENNDGYIYPKGSQSKWSTEDILYIRKCKLPSKELAIKYNTTFGQINSIKYSGKNKTKTAFKPIINLDYDFGIILGYYASEGSIGAKGKAIDFSLDGHVDVKLQVFIDQLKTSIYKVFGLNPKTYICKEDNVVKVTLHSRLISELISKICPGICYNKYVDPNILFSNEDFLRGFLEAYWNGDGHKNIEKQHAIATSCSIDLLTQIKIALSFFTIASSFSSKEPKETIVNNKRYKTNKSYILVLNGTNANRLFKYIYKKNVDIKYNSNKYSIINTGEKTTFEIKKQEFIPYNGFVYNLEVEEDNSYSLLNTTVHNCFIKDSDGFFRRSLIESCVVGRPDAEPLIFPSCGKAQFSASLYGVKDKKYIYGIDPASENDKFAIVILEDWGDHRRVVYTWTTTKAQQKVQLKKKMTKEHDFYRFAVRKIRSLFKEFPPERILVDKGGGGTSIREALGDPDKLEVGEEPIYEVIDSDIKKFKDTDGMKGKHILEIVNFTSDWLQESNEGLKKDMEDHILLFPILDSLELGLAGEADLLSGRVAVDEDGNSVFATQDTLEQNMLEIEKLKDELATIVVTQTMTGRRHWDTPDHKSPGSKVGRMRKDRYSALLLANMGARLLARVNEFVYEGVTGGFINDLASPIPRTNKTGNLYKAPAWFTENMSSGGYYGALVRRD